MTDKIQTTRVDEVSKYYESAKRLSSVISIIFWVTAFLSLLVLCSSERFTHFQEVIKVLYIVLGLCYFFGSGFLSLYLIPLAERIRRKQLLSNALATPLIHEKTYLYYNNDFAPSIARLGANVMENSLFSKEIAGKMLVSVRLTVTIYIIIWIALFSVRNSSLDLLLSITQIVFSGSILLRWLQLEFLRQRHEQTFDTLYSHFLGGHQNSTKSIATILDAFVQYETTKAISGIILSTKVFEEINNELSSKWKHLCSELKMQDHT